MLTFSVQGCPSKYFLSEVKSSIVLYSQCAKSYLEWNIMWREKNELGVQGYDENDRDKWFARCLLQN